MFIFQTISFCAFDYNSDHFRETQAVFQLIGSSPNNMNTVKIGLLTLAVLEEELLSIGVSGV